jgi:predicted nucleotidyltransferase
MSINKELDEIVVGLEKHFNALGIEFFMIGAKARDLISENVKLAISPRKTSDVDFGILVDSWDELEKLRESFKTDKNIELSSNKDNKVRYNYQGTPFDLVPFGGVEKDGVVHWPPFYEKMMTVVGYQEALDSAKLITLGKSKLKVITPEMLVALKLVSWNENQTRDKDGKDINYIITNYEKIDMDVYDCLLEDHDYILDHFDHDPVLSAIALMGLRIKMFVSAEHLILIKKVLSNEKLKSKLADHMTSSYGSKDEENINNKEKLNALQYGLKL